jgi:hypothetical protein
VDAVGDSVVKHLFIYDGEIHWIGKGNRRSSTASRSMAGRAVLGVERGEVQNLVRGNWFRIGSRFTM